MRMTGCIRGALCAMLVVVGAAQAQWRAASPYLGPCEDCWVLTVQDNDVDTVWEMVTADTGFSQMTADTTVSVAYAADSRFDSLAGGNAGNATITAVWSGGSTADSGPNALFFKDYAGNGTVASNVSALFSGAYSPRSGAYLKRIHTSLFDVAGNWTIAGFSAGYSPGNPGVGTTQTIFSVATSPDIIQIGYQKSGYIFARVSDDGRATWDSVAVAVDVYDSTYHFWALQSVSKKVGAPKDSLRLTVGNASASIAFANAVTAMTLDTAAVFSFRSGDDCRCRVDELWLVEDTTAVNAELRRYAWERGKEAKGLAADSASVTIASLKAADSTYAGAQRLKVPIGSPAVLAGGNRMLFESAVADTDEVLPLLVFSTGATPRGARLDSIPAGKLHYPIAHRVFDWKKGSPTIGSVELELLSTTDSVHVEVRAYPDLSDARNLSVGYEQLWRGVLTQGERRVTVAIDRVLPMGAYVSVWAKGSAANASIVVRLKGTRRNDGGDRGWW